MIYLSDSPPQSELVRRTDRATAWNLIMHAQRHGCDRTSDRTQRQAHYMDGDLARRAWLARPAAARATASIVDVSRAASPSTIRPGALAKLQLQRGAAALGSAPTRAVAADARRRSAAAAVSAAPAAAAAACIDWMVVSGARPTQRSPLGSAASSRPERDGRRILALRPLT